MLGKGVCDQATVVSSCHPANRIRIVKLGKIDAVKNLEHRAAPLATLQMLGLVDQIFPVSNFYFKVSLAAGISDEIFVSTIRKFNKKISNTLFHSFFDGLTTTPFVAPPPPRVPFSWLTGNDSRGRPGEKTTPCALVIEDPPFSLTRASVEQWAVSLGLDARFCWGESPSESSCGILEFLAPPNFSPASLLYYSAKTFRVSFFPKLPSQFSRRKR